VHQVSTIVQPYLVISVNNFKLSFEFRTSRDLRQHPLVSLLFHRDYDLENYLSNFTIRPRRLLIQPSKDLSLCTNGCRSSS